MDSNHIKVDKNQQIEKKKNHPIQFFACFSLWHCPVLAGFALLTNMHVKFLAYISWIMYVKSKIYKLVTFIRNELYGCMQF